LFKISGNSTDTSPLQLAAVIAPVACRPLRIASFMSIRHCRDLQKLRPIFEFLIANFSDVFTKDLKSRVITKPTIDVKIGSSSTGSRMGYANHSLGMTSSVSASNLGSPSHESRGLGSRGLSSPYDAHVAPLTPSLLSVDGLEESKPSSPSSPPSDFKNIDTSSQEWQVHFATYL